MSHLEDLLNQYYEWKGYIVRRNVKVGRLQRGGWAGELDIVAYHPQIGELLHLEPSIDAQSWAKREQRYSKKFTAGRRHIFDEVFPWLDPGTELHQVAIFVNRGKARTEIGGGTVKTVDEIVAQIRDDISVMGNMATNAIPEQFGLLRTIQLVEAGYYRRL